MIDNYVKNNDENIILEGRYELSMRPRIEFNTLTTVEASLLNRDNTNQQKTIIVGGVPRMRLSSQCIKRPISRAITDDAFNTRRVTYKIREILGTNFLNCDDEWDKVDAFVIRLVEGTSSDAGAKQEKGKKGEKKGTKKTNNAHLLSMREINTICNFIEAHKTDIIAGKVKSEEEEKLKTELVIATPMSSRVALCGRMETSGVTHETDSAVKLAHQFSVDAYNFENDYFVASEDIKISDISEKRWGTNAEAAIPGDTDINSNTLYGYSCLDVGILVDNLAIGNDISNMDVQKAIKEEAKRLVKEWSWGFVEIRPEAKQASAATYTRPTLAYITIGDRVCNISYGDIYCKVVANTASKSVMDVAIERFRNALETDEFNRNEYIGRYWVERTDCKKEDFSEELNITTNMSYKDVVNRICSVIDTIEFVKIN